MFVTIKTISYLYSFDVIKAYICILLSVYSLSVWIIAVDRFSVFLTTCSHSTEETNSEVMNFKLHVDLNPADGDLVPELVQYLKLKFLVCFHIRQENYRDTKRGPYLSTTLFCSVYLYIYHCFKDFTN